MTKRVALMLLALVMVCDITRAQGTAGSTKKQGKHSAATPAGGEQLDASARRFITHVAIDGMTEVKLGEIAEKNGGESAKEFGRRMVTDHSKANQELAQLAQSKGITLPSSLDAKSKAVVQKLSSLRGAPFDLAYAKEMVKDHKQAVALFEARANNGKNTDLRMWTANTLPTLREHLTMAEKLQAMSAPSGSKMKKHK